MTFVLQGKHRQIPIDMNVHVYVHVMFCHYSMKDVGDKLIEVVGVQSAIHAGSIYAGVRSSAKRLGQCSSVVIRSITMNNMNDQR
jgi:hypothetical protein